MGIWAAASFGCYQFNASTACAFRKQRTELSLWICLFIIISGRLQEGEDSWFELIGQYKHGEKQEWERSILQWLPVRMCIVVFYLFIFADLNSVCEASFFWTCLVVVLHLFPPKTPFNNVFSNLSSVWTQLQVSQHHDVILNSFFCFVFFSCWNS